MRVDVRLRVPADATAAIVTGRAPRDDRLWDGWNDNDSGPEKVSWLTKQLHKLQEKYIQQTRKLVECEKKAAELEALVADLKDRNERLRRIRPVHSTTNCGKGQL